MRRPIGIGRLRKKKEERNIAGTRTVSSQPAVDQRASRRRSRPPPRSPAPKMPATVPAVDLERLRLLEEQAEHGGGGALEYLSLARKLRTRRPDKVLRIALAVLNDPKQRAALGHEEWNLYEQVAIAAMDCQRLDIAKDCIGKLIKKFPGSVRVGRLDGMLLEAKGLWTEAERRYEMILSENPLDQVVHRRKIAMAKAQGNMLAAIDLLNTYLDLFMADYDAWRELAEIYVSMQMYKQAAFCYEELILSQPTLPMFHLAYAEVLYTMGGLENLQTAKKYYSTAIQLTRGKNTRALYGVCLCGSAIAQLTKGKNKDEEGVELPSLAAEALMKDYKDRAPSKMPVLTSMLKNMKLAS